ncbi:hypothetical protein JHK87_018009 [Glycine soja]|nr:hypothetical protein JHK87_018009 [Glycine soja]
MSKNTLVVALEFKDDFDRYVSDLMVLLLSRAKIKEVRGTYPIAIQNSMYGSQIFVNTDMKEILEFKGSQILGSSVYSLADRFLHNAQVKCFDEPNQLKKV